MNCNLKKNRKLKQCKTSVRAIIKKGDKILLVQRSANLSNRGHWELPGGKAEGMESKRALSKELKEEVGLITSRVEKVKTLKDGKFFVEYFNVSASGNLKMQHSEVQGVGWFRKKDIKCLKLVPHTKRFLK